MDWTSVAIVVLALAVVGSLAVMWRERRSEPPLPSVPPELGPDTVHTISDLVACDRRIEAIKMLREATGLGLRESKEWVDAWDPGSTSPLPTTSPTAQPPDQAVMLELDAEARAVHQESGYVAAIKHVRSRTRWGLAESKAYVDRLV